MDKELSLGKFRPLVNKVISTKLEVQKSQKKLNIKKEMWAKAENFRFTARTRARNNRVFKTSVMSQPDYKDLSASFSKTA